VEPIFGILFYDDDAVVAGLNLVLIEIYLVDKRWLVTPQIQVKERSCQSRQ
jgi:hypothetical protein